MNRCSKTTRKRRTLLTVALSSDVQTSNNPRMKRLAAWARKIFLQGHPIKAVKVEVQS